VTTFCRFAIIYYKYIFEKFYKNLFHFFSAPVHDLLIFPPLSEEGFETTDKKVNFIRITHLIP